MLFCSSSNTDSYSLLDEFDAVSCSGLGLADKNSLPLELDETIVGKSH